MDEEQKSSGWAAALSGSLPELPVSLTNETLIKISVAFLLILIIMLISVCL